MILVHNVMKLSFPFNFSNFPVLYVCTIFQKIFFMSNVYALDPSAHHPPLLPKRNP
jgi:hypothetical protein